LSEGGVPAAARGSRREQTKAANRAALLQAGREVFGEIGYGAASVRDIVRRTDLATGTFYNYFPDKESVLRALVDEIAGEARRRVRAARLAADSVEGFVGDSYRAYFALLAEDPETFALMRRNAGTIRALFDEPALGASMVELREDLDAGIASGALPPHDTELMAAAMVGAALEVGVRMIEREPLDVDAAAEFITRAFLGALEAFRRE
jgi:AcrR family transcriptional regulator